MASKQGRLEVQGLGNIQKNLRAEVKRIKGDTRRGIRIALAWLKGRVITVTPIKDGFLRGSWFVSISSDSKGIDSAVGFTIAYAPAVHEMTNAIFSAPGTGAKFLERPIMENADRLLRIIRDTAKI